MKLLNRSGRTVYAGGILACALACMPAIVAHADERAESGVVQIIVPFGTGGGADSLGRETARLLAGVLSAPINVVNVSGASGNKGIGKLINSSADGRTLAVLTADTFSVLAYANPGWKEADVIPLGILVQQPSALFLPENGRLKTWSDFEKEARLRPESLRVAISGLGSPDYLMLQQLAAKGIKLAPVPLSNPEERYRAVLEGKADALYEQPGDVRALVEGKQIRPVLVLNGTRLLEYKDVPTSRELGFGDGQGQFRAIVVKTGTATEKVRALSDAIDKVAAMPQFQAFLETQNALKDSYVPANGAANYLHGKLEGMKKIVDSLPLHARYIIDETEVQAWVDTF